MVQRDHIVGSFYLFVMAGTSFNTGSSYNHIEFIAGLPLLKEELVLFIQNGESKMPVLKLPC